MRNNNNKNIWNQQGLWRWRCWDRILFIPSYNLQLKYFSYNLLCIIYVFFLKEKMFTVWSYKFWLRIKADLIKIIFNFFIFCGGALIRGGRLFNSNLYFGGRLFKGGRLIEDLRYAIFLIMVTGWYQQRSTYHYIWWNRCHLQAKRHCGMISKLLRGVELSRIFNLLPQVFLVTPLR